jgi:hypothetical protein
MLRLTIGYGLGNRYFRVLWWVLGFTFLGTPANWLSLSRRLRNGKPERTLGYWVAQADMRILELSRCAVYLHRGFESHSTLRQEVEYTLEAYCKRAANGSKRGLLKVSS